MQVDRVERHASQMATGFRTDVENQSRSRDRFQKDVDMSSQAKDALLSESTAGEGCPLSDLSSLRPVVAIRAPLAVGFRPGCGDRCIPVVPLSVRGENS